MSGNPFFMFPDQNHVGVSYLYHISTGFYTSCIQTVSLTWSTNLLQEQLPYTFRITSSHSLLQPPMPSGLCPWNFFSDTQGLQRYIKVTDICSQPHNKTRYCCEGFSGAFANLGKATITFFTSVRPSVRKISAPTVKTSIKIWYLRIFRKSIEKIQVSFKMRRITGTSHEH
jgi:hypothetical protein